MKRALEILNRYFGYKSFRAAQEEIIEAILSSRYVAAVLPTGAGKSVCYQVPALLSENFSIVISPLIALMKDQVDSLNKQEEIAAFINSTMSYQESEAVLNKITYGKIKLLYLAPEKLESLKFADRIKKLKPSFLFVDEAHCISEWGHNFRPSYLKIKEFITHTSIKKIAAFTATATPEVVEDIITQLEFKEPKLFVRGFERENLHLNVIITKNKKKKCIELLRDIQGPAIVYTSSRRKAEEVAGHFNLNGFDCLYYHAGLISTERRRVQEAFLSGEKRIIVATNAFGMGIDKKDIRMVIHYNIPGSIENYYQEIGRAGRDGEESYCYLFYAEKDVAIQNHFITNSHPTKELIIKIYKAICDFNRIAVGILPEKELIVDAEYISNYTGVKISRGILYSSLKYLESAGYLLQVSDYEKKDSIQFLVGKEKLRQFVSQTANDELKNTVLLLLREFGSRIFQAPIKSSAAIISNSIGIPVTELTESLTILDNLGIMSFVPSVPKQTIKLTTPRVADDRLLLNYKMINESYLNSRRKLDKMTELVFTQDCRLKFILNYFGEKTDNYKCGKCDNCTTTGRISESASEYISEAVTQTLHEANQELSETALIQILQGDPVKESLSKFEHFGSCKKFSSTEIRIVIQELFSKGEINRSIGKRNFLSLAEKQKPESGGKEEEKLISVPDNYDDDLYLFNMLREARKKAAERFMQPGYLICPDSILREIVRKKPASKHELLGINGFNTRMFNKTGNEFLDAINKFLKEKPSTKADKKKTPLPQNIIETKKLLKKKYTLKEIADTQRLSEAVISMQIETILEYEPDTDVSHLFDRETFKVIISEVKKGYENLKELKERLPAAITYPQIRIAAASCKFNLKNYHPGRI